MMNDDPLLIAVGRILRAELAAVRASVDATLKDVTVEISALKSLEAQQNKAADDLREMRADLAAIGRASAPELVILDAIDPAQSYPRGTFARHNGGLIRAYRKTEAVGEKGLEAAGWAVVLNGIQAFQGAAKGDRAHELVFTLTDGTQARYEVPVPALIYRGVWEPGEYAPGDTCTHNGSVFHCNAATTAQPETGNAAWTLAVKRGRDARDGRS